MNVIGSRPDGWWKDRWSAMARLVGHLETWSVDQGLDVTVVFERPPSPPITAATVTLTYAARAAPDSADDEIVRLVQEADHPADITVVTSDGALADRVLTAGASVYPAKRFREWIESG